MEEKKENEIERKKEREKEKENTITIEKDDLYIVKLGIKNTNTNNNQEGDDGQQNSKNQEEAPIVTKTIYTNNTSHQNTKKTFHKTSKHNNNDLPFFFQPNNRKEKYNPHDEYNEFVKGTNSSQLISYLNEIRKLPNDEMIWKKFFNFDQDYLRSSEASKVFKNFLCNQKKASFKLFENLLAFFNKFNLHQFRKLCFEQLIKTYQSNPKSYLLYGIWLINQKKNIGKKGINPNLNDNEKEEEQEEEEEQQQQQQQKENSNDGGGVENSEKEDDNGIKIFQKGLKKCRSRLATKSIRKDYAQLYFQLGNFAIKKGNTDEAINAYKKTLKYNPNHICAHNNLASILCSSLSTRKTARKHFKIASTLRPTDLSILYNLGMLLFELGDKNESFQCFLKIQAKNPKHKESALAITKIFKENKLYNKALDWLFYIQVIDPLDPLPNIKSAQILIKIGENKKAIKKYKIALELIDNLIDLEKKKNNLIENRILIENKNENLMHNKENILIKNNRINNNSNIFLINNRCFKKKKKDFQQIRLKILFTIGKLISEIAFNEKNNKKLRQAVYYLKQFLLLSNDNNNINKNHKNDNKNNNNKNKNNNNDKNNSNNNNDNDNKNNNSNDNNNNKNGDNKNQNNNYDHKKQKNNKKKNQTDTNLIIEANLSLGKIFLKLKHYEKAKESFNLVLKKDYKNFEAKLYLVIVESKTNIKNAIKTIQQLSIKNPKNSDCQLQLSRLYKKQGKIFIAIQKYQYAMKLNPKTKSGKKIPGPILTDLDKQFLNLNKKYRPDLNFNMQFHYSKDNNERNNVINDIQTINKNNITNDSINNQNNMINCCNSKFYSLEQIQILCGSLSKKKVSLKKLNLTNRLIGSEGALIILKFLKNNWDLQSIQFAQSDVIELSTVKSINNFINRNKKINGDPNLFDLYSFFQLLPIGNVNRWNTDNEDNEDKEVDNENNNNENKVGFDENNDDKERGKGAINLLFNDLLKIKFGKYYDSFLKIITNQNKSITNNIQTKRLLLAILTGVFVFDQELKQFNNQLPQKRNLNHFKNNPFFIPKKISKLKNIIFLTIEIKNNNKSIFIEEEEEGDEEEGGRGGGEVENNSSIDNNFNTFMIDKEQNNTDKQSGNGKANLQKYIKLPLSIAIVKSKLLRNWVLQFKNIKNNLIFIDYSKRSFDSLQIIVNYWITGKILLSPNLKFNKIMNEINGAIEYYQMNPKSCFFKQLKKLKNQFSNQDQK
ncbi:udp-n-acetylglucosamine--peptide n-acetylglucosaminyltransferase [Anaeramoeba flamelloides]|uniref:Udp-n-acetylglucosamine--peptide n-acetylglucosaminyltransferase n=1 Tax=Anaeramoeba flamelloides TaxID=1746091 RepID=A0ABQ8XXZ9_9EUKA|nr:udp-n-acetylglucosamine--peptide n-acetylglucosaminyltransferase [Anaeramoeba flamelloides]